MSRLMAVLASAAGLTAGASCFASLLVAQGSFEGTVTYQMTLNGGPPMTMPYQIKGSKMRVEMNQGQAVMLIDGSTGLVTTLMPAMKSYVQMNSKDLMKNAQQMPGAPTPPPTPNFKLTKTGKSETIAGVSCDDYTVADANDSSRTMEMCVAKGMGNGMNSGGNAMMLPGFDEIMKQFKDGFFLMKMRASGQDHSMEMVATALERKTLEASIFDIPSDYKLMDMSNMQMQMTAPPQ